MQENRKKLLLKIRYVFVALTVAVLILSVESIFTGQEIFKQYAAGIAIFGLLIISLAISRIIKKH